MHTAQEHRGLDSEGFHERGRLRFAVARLSIIDPLCGDQPIKNEQGDVVVIQNGEIYNYRTLRKELISLGHEFLTGSDTEVLVHGYEQWGIDGLLKRIDGMFAFAIEDFRNGVLHIVRDFFGEKPLYYVTNDSCFLFASEMQAILMTGRIAFTVDPAALKTYLRLHYVPGERTIVSGIKKLLPGHRLEVSLRTRNVQTKKYWSLSNDSRDISYDTALVVLRELLEESVASRLIADVPVGVFLSGGIDSSILTALARPSSDELNTFSVGFPGSSNDESPFALAVSKVLGTQHHHVNVHESDAIDVFLDVIDSMDEPCGDQALLPLLLLSRRASEHVKVVLTGDGADECFGGYDYYQAPSGISTFFNEEASVTASGFPLLSSKELSKDLLAGEFRCDEHLAFHELESSIASFEDPLSRAQVADLLSWLPDDLLMKSDKMTMAASIEARSPYLSKALVAFALNLPASFKRQGRTSKRILRDACYELLPQSILIRQKHPFIVPCSQWLRNGFRDLLLDSLRLQQDDGIHTPTYGKLITEHCKGIRDWGRLLWSIFCYRLWFARMEKRIHESKRESALKHRQVPAIPIPV